MESSVATELMIFNTMKLIVRSTPTLRVVCAWCPEYDPTLLVNRKASHTICPKCLAKFDEMDVDLPTTQG
jgi:hypothetical protein